MKKTTKTKKTSTKIIAKPIKAIKKSKAAIKTIKKAPKTKIPAWEIMLNVMSPTIKRPRRTSLHTLATVIGHKDPLKLAKEMKKSDKVVGYVCPDVKTPIFYLKSLANHPGMIDTRDSKVWGKLEAFIKKHPYPAVKGFKRFASPTWSGGSYGKGKFIAGKSAMDVPYETGDYAYANEVIKSLKKAGYKPGIKPYKVANAKAANFYDMY